MSLIVAIKDDGLCKYYQEKVVLMNDGKVKINVELLSDAVQKELEAELQNVNVAHYYHDSCCSEIRTNKEVVHFSLIVYFDLKFFICFITLLCGSKFKVHGYLMQSPHGKPEIIPKILPLCFFLLVNLILKGAPVIAEIICLCMIIRRSS